MVVIYVFLRVREKLDIFESLFGDIRFRGYYLKVDFRVVDVIKIFVN